MTIEFALQVSGSAFGDDLGAMVAECRRAEDLGFSEIRVADHPGTTFDPFVLLTAIAAGTTTIRVGTYVLNLGVRHPLDVAIGAASVDAVSEGRFTLGVGAGHTPHEWEARGQRRPGAADRVARVVESVEVLRPLLRGQTVDHVGDHVRLEGAVVDKPRPVQGEIPLLIGGGNRRLIDLAAARADIVGLSGLGRTLPDGHNHEANWSPAATGATIERVRTAAEGRSVPPRIDVLVQAVDPDPDRTAAAERVADEVDQLTVADALDCPFILFGPAEALADQLAGFERRWGITSYTVRPPALDHVAAVMNRLHP